MSPVLAMFGFVILSLINPLTSFLPYTVAKNINWFSQNPILSNNIAIGFFITSGLFCIIAIYNILATFFDDRISDKDLG